MPELEKAVLVVVTHPAMTHPAVRLHEGAL